MGKIVEQNVPLTFQMRTFLNKMECFKYFNYQYTRMSNYLRMLMDISVVITL